MLVLFGRRAAGRNGCHRAADNPNPTTEGVPIMSEMQMTLDGALVPTAPHVDDIVVCVDGSECRHGDALFDCEGGAHRTDEDRHDRDVQVVSDFLDEVGKWAEDYCTGNSDYPDAYSCLINEGCHDWDDDVREWIENEYGDECGHTNFDDYIEEIVEKVCEELDGEFDCEAEYNSNEYAAYSGSGCCLGSFDIGEHEEQIEINGHDVLRVLHERGDLDDVLDDVNCDVYINRDRRREKNEETGYYEPVGRETYMPYEHNREHPDLLIYVNISGQWQWVVPADRMEELVCEALLDYHGYTE